MVGFCEDTVFEFFSSKIQGTQGRQYFGNWSVHWTVHCTYGTIGYVNIGNSNIYTQFCSALDQKYEKQIPLYCYLLLLSLNLPPPQKKNTAHRVLTTLRCRLQPRLDRKLHHFWRSKISKTDSEYLAQITNPNCVIPVLLIW